MIVFFNKKKSIQLLTADNWMETAGVILFYDKEKNIIASISAFPGMIIQDNTGGKKTIFNPMN